MLGALILSAPMLAAAAPAGRLELSVQNLRSAKGLIQICLTREPNFFPDCEKDPAARRMSAPIASAGHLEFSGLPSGSYAVALFHDENSNGKLDTFAGIPREGFGFSRNPRVTFGPPSFAATRFAITAGAAEEAIRMKYIL